jgi:DNA-binding transcriptional regulator YdaS (Cro superfamily)
MYLREYLYKKNKTLMAFAKELGCDRTYLANISLGRLRPGKRLAADIERLTNGEVTAADLMNSPTIPPYSNSKLCQACMAPIEPAEKKSLADNAPSS